MKRGNIRRGDSREVLLKSDKSEKNGSQMNSIQSQKVLVSSVGIGLTCLDKRGKREPSF